MSKNANTISKPCYKNIYTPCDDALPSFTLPRCTAEKNLDLEQNFSSFLSLTAHLQARPWNCCVGHFSETNHIIKSERGHML